MGETAKDYVLTATLAYVVNRATGAVLGLVKAITNYPAHQRRRGHRRVGAVHRSAEREHLPADRHQAGAARVRLEAGRQGEDRRRQRLRHGALGRAHPRPSTPSEIPWKDSAAATS